MVNAKGAENVSLQFVKDSRARKEETKLLKINCCMEERLLSSNPGFNKTFGIYGAGIGSYYVVQKNPNLLSPLGTLFLSIGHFHRTMGTLNFVNYYFLIRLQILNYREKVRILSELYARGRQRHHYGRCRGFNETTRRYVKGHH